MLSMMLAAATAAQVPLLDRWAEFTRNGSLNHTAETVEIADAISQREATSEYKLRLTRVVRGASTGSKWTNSKECPLVRVVLAEMRDLQMPKPAPHGFTDVQRYIILDGSSYSLTAPASCTNGSMTLTSVDGSPLADWINASFARLASCWRTTVK